MSMERGSREGEAQASRGYAGRAPAPSPPEPIPGTVVQVELGGVALSSTFRGEARRMGIVVHAPASEQAWPFLGPANATTVVATVDPFDLPPAIQFVRELRRRGSSAGVLAVAGSRGLRRTTSFPLRRAGVDAFLALSADTSEFALRLQEAARLTRTRRGRPFRPVLPDWVQSREDDGDYRPMTGEELGVALRERLAVPEEGPFALVLLRMRAPRELAWQVLKRWIRLEEGDLLALLEGDGLAVALQGTDRGAAGTIIDRIARSQPGLGLEALTILEVPPDGPALQSQLKGWEEAAWAKRYGLSMKGRST